MSLLDRLLRRGSPAPAPIWKGIYSTFAGVPGSVEAHGSEEWRAILESDLDAVRRGAWSEDFVAEHDQLLLLLFALGGGRILDYGGGVGQTYEYLRRVLPSRFDLACELVEVPRVVDLGRRVQTDPNVTIRTEPGTEPHDIVFVKSVLQYIEDHQQILRTLFGFRARFVVLEKFSGVEGPSYVTAQLNVSSTAIPYRFISFDEVFTIANDAGYERLVWRRLPRVYDQADFPAELRMGKASTLVFGRRD